MAFGKMKLNDFLTEWRSESETVELFTSGSTGVPKRITATKRQMEASARITCEFLNLKAGNSALLCLPLDYIAGKMMVVRSEVASLNIISVEPDGHPLKNIDVHVDFAAMVPLQVYNSLLVPEEKEKLMNVRQLIIGGSPVSDDMALELKCFPNGVWSTYGMTETLSHIALRRLSGPQASEWYSPLPGVEVYTDEMGKLIIHAPAVCSKVLKTNDIAEMSPDGSNFRIVGRADNVINSGGVKIYMEEIEKAIAPHIACPFAVTKKTDRKFGEIVVLIAEAGDRGEMAEIEKTCKDLLPEYSRPKVYIYTNNLPLTGTGKINRMEALRIAENYHYICK